MDTGAGSGERRVLTTEDAYALLMQLTEGRGRADQLTLADWLGVAIESWGDPGSVHATILKQIVDGMVEVVLVEGDTIVFGMTAKGDAEVRTLLMESYGVLMAYQAVNKGAACAGPRSIQ